MLYIPFWFSSCFVIWEKKTIPIRNISTTCYNIMSTILFPLLRLNIDILYTARFHFLYLKWCLGICKNPTEKSIDYRYLYFWSFIPFSMVHLEAVPPVHYMMHKRCYKVLSLSRSLKVIFTCRTYAIGLCTICTKGDVSSFLSLGQKGQWSTIGIKGDTRSFLFLGKKVPEGHFHTSDLCHNYMHKRQKRSLVFTRMTCVICAVHAQKVIQGPFSV